MLTVDLPASFASVIAADPNALPAPCGRHPAPTRGAIETRADGERDSGESEAISEEETVTETEARSKAGTPYEAAAKTCTTESTADKPASETAAAKTTTEATATEARCRDAEEICCPATCRQCQGNMRSRRTRPPRHRKTAAFTSTI
jgi:hypothetical protein